MRNFLGMIYLFAQNLRVFLNAQNRLSTIRIIFKYVGI